MGRRILHDESRFLDAAVQLAATGGPATITMAAVARAAGAPSGSLYHRFGDRAALLAALWLRTVSRFQAGFVSAVENDPDRTSLVNAARYVVNWSAANPQQTAILLAGARSLGLNDWDASARRQHEAGNDRALAAVRAVAHTIGADSPRDLERVILATVIAPYALVRAHLHDSAGIPDYLPEVAADAARALLHERVE